MPTEPAAAWTSSVSPAPTPSSRSAPEAVCAAATSAAAVGKSSSGGLATTSEAGTTTWVAWLSHHRRAEHRVADRQARDPFAEQFDHPRVLLADLVREVLRSSFDPPLAYGDVEGLHAGRPYPDPDLARAGLRIGEVGDA
nr:hypothetical protein GCM10020092_024990 [Actinoplanes digitatis]